MNSDNLILRETTFPPLVNKNDFLNSAEFDANFINIYEDLVALCSTTGVIEFDEGTTYDDSINQFASFNGRLYRWIDSAPGAGVTPGTEGASEYWTEIFPTDLAHRKNSDEFLAEGTIYEVSARDIRTFIDAGLTTTTDLSITEKTGTSFKLNSSTGADVTIPAATSSEAGLLTAGDKVKLQRLTGTNTGDQTLETLGAEAVANKATDFSTLNDELYPSVQATETRIGERIDELKGAPPAELDTLEKMASAIANPTRMTTLGKNATGSTLYKGTVVYINGASGGVPTFAKAKADSEATSSRTLGVILADISNLGEGYAVTLGDVDSLDTRTTATNPFTSDTLAVGDQLYLSPTTAGYVTNVKPAAPNHLVYIGKVLNTGTHDGEILYQIQNGYELEELHNVKSGATDGQYLKYVASSGLWEPTTLSTALTVGTTAINSGTNTRILFQNGGVVSQSTNLTFDDTLRRLQIKATTGNGGADVPLLVRNSADNLDLFRIRGNGDHILGSETGVTLNLSAKSGYSYTTLNLNGQGNTERAALRQTSNRLTFTHTNSDTVSATLTTSGFAVGFGDIAASAKVDIKAAGALSTDLALRVRNSADTANLLNVRGDGPVLGVGTNSGNSFAIGGSQGYIGSDSDFTIGALTYGSNFKLNIKGYSDIRYQWTHSNGHNASVGYFGGSDLYVFNDSTTNTAVLNTDALRLGINSSLTNVQASSALQVESTTKGFLPPRMTTTQKNAISSPSAGLVVYDTTLNKLCIFTTAWETITSV